MKKPTIKSIIENCILVALGVGTIVAILHLAGCASITGGDIQQASEIAGKVTTEGITDETIKKAKELVESIRDRGTLLTTPTSIVWIVKEDPSEDQPYLVSQFGDEQKTILAPKEENKTEPSASEGGADAVPFESLSFCWGGFDGSNARLVDGCRVADLSVSGSKMTYKWVKGGCENLGASSSSDYDNTIACFFCLIDGKWFGGKFDWISTSRTSRSFSNVSSGYHGWDKNAIGKASAYAFVIVSKDGKKRSNVTSTTK